jgi:hypothetical protein
MMLPNTPYQVQQDPALRAGAATAIVETSIALTVGFLLGGLAGAGAAVALAGAARNGQRAAQYWSHPEASYRQEAASSGTSALVDALLGGYFLIEAIGSRRKR